MAFWRGYVGAEGRSAWNRRLGACVLSCVSVNIYAFLKAQRTGKVVELSCAIGDEYIDGKPYSEIVEIARNYIRSIGGFRAFGEWGLVRVK